MSLASINTGNPSGFDAEKENLDSARNSINRLLLERIGEPRKDGEPIDTFLERIRLGMMKIAIQTFWNVKYDAQPNPAYTSDPDQNPLVGAQNDFDLVNKTVVYSNEQWMMVRSLGALCDKIHLYFDDPGEAARAKEFIGTRMKDVLQQMSVLHNRAAVRRQNYDKTGPDGMLAALKKYASESTFAVNFEKLFRNEVWINGTEKEKNFLRAIELNCAVWSVMALPSSEVQRLHTTGRINPVVYAIATNPDSRKAVPYYQSDIRSGRALIAKLVQLGTQPPLSLSQEEAELAFHVGESFRIGCGLDTYLDRSWKIDNGVETAVISAQEGGPKGAMTGSYVESISKNDARPDFNKALADVMVNTFVPHAGTLQVGHAGADISGYGDKRATLMEVFAVDGAIKDVDWTTASSSPDKAVYDAANQAVQFWWKLASLKAAKDPSLVFPTQELITYVETQSLTQTDRLRNIKRRFGLGIRSQIMVAEFIAAFTPYLKDLFNFEQWGLDVPSHPITGTVLQAIKERLKSLRDYWINAYIADSKSYPIDFLRATKQLFYKNTQYPNKRIQGIIENAEAKARAGNFNTDEQKKFLLQINGYITYDVLVRVAVNLFAPDFRTISEELNPLKNKTKHQLWELYNSLDRLVSEEMNVATLGGGKLANTAALSTLVAQVMLYRDALKDDQEKMVNAGYAYSPYARSQLLPITRGDIIQILQDYGMALGRSPQEHRSQNGRISYPLKPMYAKPTEATITPQDIVDRLVLLQYLFPGEKAHQAN